MIEITEEMIERAKRTIAKGKPHAAGYRLLIKPIQAEGGLEAAQMKEFEALAQAGFQTKTKEQQERESKGTHHGILVNIGEQAYKEEKLGAENWVNEGDVVIFDRYAGVEIELPPGSGDLYRFTNDESVLGYMEYSDE